MSNLTPVPLEYGSGFPTLLRKEVKRFYKVGFQTVAAPVLTAILYLMIFGHVLEGKEVYGVLSYTSFLIPGLVMMSVLQNAFANTSSSLIQSKITGNLVFVLLAPLSHFEFYTAYVLAAVFRGVVGIVASRIKDRHHMPTFVFAPSQMSTPQGSVAVIKGSGRSIPGFHLRDALDWVSKQHPHLLIKFGGHAMAAGCTILEKDFSVFESSLSEVTKAWLGDIRGLQELWTDGELEEQYFNTEVVQTLQAQVWGQGFPAPLFCNSVEILKQRIVGEKHLSMKVLLHGVECDAIWFNHTQSLSRKTELVYKVELDTWMGRQKLKLYVEASK